MTMLSSLPAESRLRKWLLLLALCTFGGLLSATTFYTGEQVEGGTRPFSLYFVNELTAAYSFYLLLPLILAFIRRFPFERSTWPAALAAHLPFSMVVGATHTLLMTWTRTPLYPLFGFGDYRLGNPFFRFLMEYQKQVLLYVAVVVVVHLIQVQRERRRREQQAAELQVQAAQLQSRLAEAQLNVLRGEIQPHFLFNTLNMISTLMYEDTGRADRMIARLSSLLRASIEHTQRPRVPLWREIDLARDYLEIMGARFEDRLSYRLDVAPGLGGALVPSFLLQPLVENAVKHGDPGGERPLAISIEVSESGGQLHVEILDNGPGITQPVLDSAPNGVGISNTRQRLDRLYPGRHQFDIRNRTEGGCAVSVEIPLEFERATEKAPAGVA